jgi:hypothetical protein
VLDVKNVLTFLLLLAVAPAAQEPPVKQTPGFQFDWRWSDVGSQTVTTSKDINEADRTALLVALAAQFKDSPKPMEQAAQTHVGLVDLNGDGVPEIICQPSGNHICSPTGNCPFWVFQKTGTKYRLILEKGAVQGFAIRPTRTNGYSDFVLGMHGSATSQGLFVYQFRDGRYRRTGCYDADWTYLGKDGEYHDLEEPRITPCKK